MRPFAEFSPERYAARIAPRSIVMVNGVDDPQMPRAAVQSLYDAARQPKTLVWLRTGHLMPGDTTLIRALVAPALSLLPAHPPADEEQQHHDNVADAVPRADALRARAATDRQPVHETENGGEQAGDDSRDDHVERGERPRAASREQRDDVEDHRHREHTE